MLRKEYKMCYVNETEDDFIIGFLGVKDNLDFIKNIIFLEFLVKEGDSVEIDDTLLNAEAMKGTNSLKSPIFGKIIEVNNDVEDDPECLSKNPETWLIRIKK